ALAWGHEGDELVVADLDEDVARRDLRDLAVLALALDANDLAERLLLDAGEERLDDAELHVGLEQREAHLAQRGLDVLLGQLGEAGEAISGGFEAFGERVEHGLGVRLSTGRASKRPPTSATRAACRERY